MKIGLGKAIGSGSILGIGLRITQIIRYLPLRRNYSKSPHIRTYQNKNLEAVFPELCTLQLRTCFSLMKYGFLLQG